MRSRRPVLALARSAFDEGAVKNSTAPAATRTPAARKPIVDTVARSLAPSVRSRSSSMHVSTQLRGLRLSCASDHLFAAMMPVHAAHHQRGPANSGKDEPDRALRAAELSREGSGSGPTPSDAGPIIPLVAPDSAASSGTVTGTELRGRSETRVRYAFLPGALATMS